MSATEYLKANIMAQLLNLGSFPPPAKLYLALGRSSPSGAWANELSDNGYQRVQLGSFVRVVYPADCAVANAKAIAFPKAGAGGWCDVSAWAVFDAETGGNILFCAEIYPAATILEDEWVVIKPGWLLFGCSGASKDGQYETGEYVAERVLNHIFNGQTFAPPPLYLALQVGSSSYHPTPISGGWTAQGSCSFSNHALLSWGTTGEDWGYLQLVVQITAEDWFCLLTHHPGEIVPVGAGDEPEVSAGAVTVSQTY
jgi:hypothetical protein